MTTQFTLYFLKRSSNYHSIFLFFPLNSHIFCSLMTKLQVWQLPALSLGPRDNMVDIGHEEMTTFAFWHRQIVRRLKDTRNAWWSFDGPWHSWIKVVRVIFGERKTWNKCSVLALLVCMIYGTGWLVKDLVWSNDRKPSITNLNS